MEETIFELAKSQGIWALLFVSLFIYTIRDSRDRENKYQDREVKYQELADKLSAIINDEIRHLRETITNFMCGKKE